MEFLTKIRVSRLNIAFDYTMKEGKENMTKVLTYFKINSCECVQLELEFGCETKYDNLPEFDATISNNVKKIICFQDGLTSLTIIGLKLKSNKNISKILDHIKKCKCNFISDKCIEFKLH